MVATATWQEGFALDAWNPAGDAIVHLRELLSLSDRLRQLRAMTSAREGTATVTRREFIAAAIQTHADTVMRVCAVYFREKADREDAFQEAFLRLARHEGAFNDDEHLKAWLIRVTANICKDTLKSSAAKNSSLDELQEEGFSPQGSDGQEGQRSLERQEVFAALQSLEERYRSVLYLKYYEGYTAAQIAQALDMPENTVYTNLARGRKLLKGVLHG